MSCIGGSADPDLCRSHENIVRQIKISRRRPFANASRCVVGAATGRTVITTIVALHLSSAPAERDAADMRADSDRDQPVIVIGLGSLRQGFWISQFFNRIGVGGGLFGRGEVAQKHRLAAPADDDCLPRLWISIKAGPLLNLNEVTEFRQKSERCWGPDRRRSGSQSNHSFLCDYSRIRRLMEGSRFSADPQLGTSHPRQQSLSFRSHERRRALPEHIGCHDEDQAGEHGGQRALARQAPGKRRAAKPADDTAGNEHARERPVDQS